MGKWYEILPDLEKPVSKYLEKTLVPEKMSWWQKPLFMGAGIFDKKDMEKHDWLGDLGSRGWLGPINQRSRGEEGENAYENSSTTKGLKKTGTILAALAAMFGVGKGIGAMGIGSGAGAGGTGVEGAVGAEAGAEAGAGGASGWMNWARLGSNLMGNQGGGQGNQQQELAKLLEMKMLEEERKKMFSLMELQRLLQTQPFQRDNYPINNALAGKNFFTG
jgi:hypothetical protein